MGLFRKDPTEKFAEDDPLRYLHVPRRERQKTDDGPGATALGNETGDDAEDLNEYRPGGKHYSDEVVEDLA